MRIWILGRNGFLGKSLYAFCQKQQIDCLATSKEEVDVSNKEQLQLFVNKYHPTHIVNCSGYTNVDLAEKEEKTAYDVNAEGPYYLGLLTKKFPLKVLHLSTDYVFDGGKEEAYVETDVCNPLNVYGKSKREGEIRLLDTAPGSCVLRISWLYGGSGKNFLSQLSVLLKQKESLKIDAIQYSRPTFVKDATQAAMDLLSESGIYHFANEGACNRFEFAEESKRCLQKNHFPTSCLLIPMQSNEKIIGAIRPKRSVLSTSKIENLLKKKPRHWKLTMQEYLLHA